ncbi:carcinoembryonic antigen-related cell adhesion molecule 5-like [Salarias fasciatus]|uniref:carcinoembryonic antigen-related cell adhesion molecule 5-like n=1 Tax=Salarias fasciatus TaxID=181472 RepID=UPI0011767704|nr:carcinoembryonic antigen-related cell adhesion molecule 5-like [Salarias fasciatus]
MEKSLKIIGPLIVALVKLRVDLRPGRWFEPTLDRRPVAPTPASPADGPVASAATPCRQTQHGQKRAHGCRSPTAKAAPPLQHPPSQQQLLTGFTKGAGILPDGPLDAAIGGSVLLETTKTPPETPFLVVTWSFGANNIGISTPSGENIGVNYTGRARITHSTGSLELSRLTAADSGDYGVSIIPSTGGQESGTITLRVHAPVSDVTIDPETLNLVEFNKSLRLSCNSSGSPLSFLWIKDGSEITASDRVQITDGGRLLSIVNVRRDDQGSYTCKVSNPVSTATSDPATVTVYYGPENIKLTPPAETNHAAGSDITMVCSADSSPPAQFTWYLNGSQLQDTGSELKLVDVNKTQSGSYSCQAFNTETLRFQISEPAVINILEEISDASVKPTNPPVEGTSLNLTCEASGSGLSRKWMKDDSDLILTDNMKLHDNNRVLSFTTVSRNDNGEYVCNITSSFGSRVANFSLTVNYGPENVEISGENQIKVGSTIELSCTADSEPLAEFTWLFNETQILNSSSELIKDNANISDSGAYTCRATNEITGKSGSAEHRLSVTSGGNELKTKCVHASVPPTGTNGKEGGKKTLDEVLREAERAEVILSTPQAGFGTPPCACRADHDGEEMEKAIFIRLCQLRSSTHSDEVTVKLTALTGAVNPSPRFPSKARYSGGPFRPHQRILSDLPVGVEVLCWCATFAHILCTSWRRAPPS